MTDETPTPDRSGDEPPLAKWKQWLAIGWMLFVVGWYFAHDQTYLVKLLDKLR